jgi:quercetin dioxygenase-like cupin family protein
MKHFIRAFLFAATLIAATGIVQAATIILPGNLKWAPGTGTSAGQMIAVVYGDPSKPGPFIIRVKSPDGYAVAAHYHAAVENVTVLQGTLLLGFGDKADKAKTTAIPAGGFYSIPKGVHHYAFAKGETIVQIYSIGPRTKQRIEP